MKILYLLLFLFKGNDDAVDPDMLVSGPQVGIVMKIE